MKAQQFMVASALLILAGCQHFGGGNGMPTVTRTGMVKDIIIREDVAPATLTVNPGDEIRWINKRQGDARVVFLDPVTEMLSCQRNFGGLMGGDRNQYTAKLSSNDSASLCFRRAGEIKYVVRADSTLPSGEANIPGTIMVGGADTAGSTTSSDRTSMRDTSPGNETGEPSRQSQDRMSTR